MVVVVVVVVVTSRSKNRQKSKEVQRPEKSAKAIGSEEQSFLTSNTRLAFMKMGSSRTKLTIENYWLSLNPLIIEGTTWCWKYSHVVPA